MEPETLLTLQNTLALLLFFSRSRKIKGLIISFFGYKIIGLNSQLPEEMQRIVVAHELGHYHLHPQGIGYFFVINKTFFSNSKYEYQANQFAAELLLAEDKPFYRESINEYAKRKKVPIELVKVWLY